MNTRLILLTVSVLAPLAALHAMPPGLETAGDVQPERVCVDKAERLPVEPGAKRRAEEADRVLGAAVEPVSRLVAVHLPTLLAPNQGLLVTDVAPDSPCAAAGIAPDDILHSCNAVPLLDSRQLRERWDDIDDMEPLVLGVIRKGVLYVTKLAGPATAEQPAASPPTAAGSPDARPTATPDGGQHHFTGSREAIIGQIRTLPERLQTYITRALCDQDPRSGVESEWPSGRGSRPRGESLP